MSVELVIGVAVVQTILSALIAIFSFYKYRQRDRLMILVGLLFSFSFAFNVFQFLALKFGANITMNIIGDVYEIIFFILAGVIYDCATNQQLRRTIMIFSGLFLIGSIMNLLFGQKDLASITKLASNLMLLVYCVAYFFKLMRDLPAIHVHRLPMFWINSAFLLYSAGTVFLFAFIEYVINAYADKVASFWLVNLSLFIMQQLIIVFAVAYDLKNLNRIKLDMKNQF
jgi:hypothetical protein